MSIFCAVSLAGYVEGLTRLARFFSEQMVSKVAGKMNVMDFFMKRYVGCMKNNQVSSCLLICMSCILVFLIVFFCFFGWVVVLVLGWGGGG